MFRVVGELPRDLHRFIGEPERVSLPFSFSDDEVGAAIIQIAAGKASVELLQQGGDAEEVSTNNLQASAQRFVANVMLAPGSDLFTVLGVSSSGEPPAYRDNYRRLMAMVHPDARPTGFPTDAAIRVNHAYAVLSDAEQRENYQSQRSTHLDNEMAGGLGKSAMGGANHPQQKARLGAERGLARRLGALLFRARERGLLLWLALLLLVPVGGAFYLTLSENPQVRLVEARPKLNTSQATSLLAQAHTSTLAPPAASNARVDKADKVLIESTQNDVARKLPPEASPRPYSPTVVPGTPTPALAFETSLSMSQLSTPAQPITAAAPANAPLAPPASKGMGSLAASPNSDSTQSRTPAISAVEAMPVAPSPNAVARAETVNGQSPQSSQNIAVAARTPGGEVRAPVTTAVGTPVVYRLRSADIEEVLTRFSNAYEAGSMSAFDQVLAPSMPGRGQLLSDYGRIFQTTRNRSIRFVQLKHAPAGERIATRGYAVVTTTDLENRVSKQRVFLEFEIGADHSAPRIERISNYVIN